MKKTAYIQMTLAMLLIGSLFVASKVIVQSFPVFTASFLRQFLAFLFLVGMVLYQQSSIPKVSRRDAWVLFAQGFIGIFMFSLFVLYGLKHTSSLNANIITSMTPLSMMGIAVLLLGERLTMRRVCALVLALLGTLLINVLSGREMSALGGSVWLGNALLVGAVIAEGVFFGFGKLLSRPMSATWLSLILTAIGSALFLPLAIYDVLTFDFSSVPWLVWLLVLYTGIGVTAVGVILMNLGMKHVSTSSASIFTALMPVSGVVLSVLCLHETFYWYHALGMGLTLLAVALVMFEKTAVPHKTQMPTTQI